MIDEAYSLGGVRAIAALFALCGIYLAIVGLLMWGFPGRISMSSGAPLLSGLELAGPYMFLLMSIVGGAVAWGLLKLNNVARHVAMLIAITGIVMLVPTVSAATAEANPKTLVLGGLGIIIRVMVAWYLGREETKEAFQGRRGTE